VLIESKADVNTANNNGSTPAHHAASHWNTEYFNMLLNAKADVNTSTLVMAMSKCGDKLRYLQLLVNAKVDLTVQNNSKRDSLYWAMRYPAAPHMLGIPFAIMSCNTNIKNAHIDDRDVTPAVVNTHIKEFEQIHNFIDEYHTVTEHALTEDVVVDTRVGRGDYGLYHEPLEQVLLYLGLSMEKNQTVNTSIDGKSVTRAMIPGHPTNANLWFELYHRTYCSSCSTRLTEPKKCPCRNTTRTIYSHCL
jgi:hypothetical protein